jgi:four helix bundle protein
MENNSKIVKFEDLNVWQKSQDLAVEIYQIFKYSKEFDLRSQIIRATLSISNNIAEGFDRHSKKEFIRFLNIVLASNSELKSMLYFLKRVELLNELEAIKLQENLIEISKLLNRLIKSVAKSAKN